MTTLIPILGDQLSMSLSSLRDADPATSSLLMVEVIEEATYVVHHKRKIAYIFSAMRHHADALRDAGWRVDYVPLDDSNNSGSFTGEVARAIARHAPDRIVVTAAGEWRVAAMIDSWETLFGIPVDVRPDTRFIATLDEFAAWAKGRKQWRMEYFYRDMRRKTGLLMDGDKPVGGDWNFDSENRKAAPRDPAMPRPLSFAPDAITREVLALVADRFTDHPGSLDGFDFAVTRADALAQQAHFLAHALPRFGDYQDAMLSGEPFLWHSLLSPYINSGLLGPLELAQAVEARFHDGDVPINAAEGFIRQIIGWREYVRGIYWHEGPDYATRNFLNATRPLPDFYWTGDTDMHCLSQAIGQTLDFAYAHHIHRLMITGNFAMLIGVDPAEVHRWYLAVYADAYEWVELPNTLGMSQFGDGGLLASKPYAASGAYINRMSDYCGRCRYDVKQRTGPDACPFNALYWDFLARNAEKLAGNQRLAMPYRNWAKMTPQGQAELRASAASFLDRLDGAQVER
ncbi:cryptochrome/photolyase family protein [Sphingomonas sp. 28-62-11]|uniref:cryptochrome/photolyase family protein n=1 Tax=Sphingomonas sp. 28-62-11 TaxID=1970432 RepID=UPI000BD58EE7|nr:MAG: cryptochrome/photolyase family protein [Sphingomonas sp. 28-62-11]